MRPGNFTQLYVHCIFSPYARENLLHEKYQPELYHYIASTIKGLKHKPIIISGMPDHIHILIGLSPTQSVSDFVRDVKRSSSLFINNQKWIVGKFKWQSGYGAFSYSRSDLNNVYQYIKNQKEHHKKKTFRDEYMELLDSLVVPYDEKCLFDFYEPKSML